ncbi:MAG: PBP1A family penicillin-binding protein [Desulfobacteraceae bacterium]|nr:PBP1A family penicillin-binding protein [Desulfobacteraceae bacterium]
MKITGKRWAFLLPLVAITGGAGIGIALGLFRDLPQIRELQRYQPSAITQIVSSDGMLLGELYREKRAPVPLNRIPPDLTQALLATEDRNFYRHSGVDMKGIARALYHDLMAGGFVEGASTLTQQLAKTLFLTPKKTITRKIREAILAFQIERRLTKDEILELYLNQVYFGSGAYGVASAAEVFFGKKLPQLTLAECALIAGMPKAPSQYSPRVNAEAAIRRRDTVLQQMRRTGLIDEKRYRTAMAEPVRVRSSLPKARRAAYFVEIVRSELEESFGPATVYRAGLTVITTLDWRLQQAAEAAVARGLAALAERSPQQTKDPQQAPQGALIALDNQTGAILSMVGGRDFSESPYNRATTARRQPGSAFKPIVYALAIEQGWTQADTLLNSPIAYPRASGEGQWRPENFSGGYSGEMPLRKALAQSKNIPAVRLNEKLGPEAVVRFGKRLGIASPLRPNLSLALGTSEVTLLELTAAYAVFANRGQWMKPFGVETVKDRNGRIVWRAQPEGRWAMDPASAAIMVDMLQAVVKEGTGRKALVLDRPVGGKTGTTNDYRDALFIGFSPSLTAGVWVGRDQPASLGPRETGARAALPIWIDYMSRALRKRPYRYFDIPDGVVRVAMDAESGRPVAPEARGSVSALFRTESAPAAP